MSQQALCLHMSQVDLNGVEAKVPLSALENACLRALSQERLPHEAAGEKNESCQWIKTDPLVNHFRYDQ